VENGLVPNGLLQQNEFQCDCCHAYIALQNPAAAHIFRPLKKISKPSNHRGKTMFNFVRRWQRYNRTVSELNHLSNRELADLGMTRSDIHRVAREATRS
jgi:uncharacterized protein YjiS (DUF1127 family)